MGRTVCHFLENLDINILLLCGAERDNSGWSGPRGRTVCRLTQIFDRSKCCSNGRRWVNGGRSTGIFQTWTERFFFVSAHLEFCTADDAPPRRGQSDRSVIVISDTHLLHSDSLVLNYGQFGFSETDSPRKLCFHGFGV